MAIKPPPDRLYGRTRTHALRPRQETLLQVTLPRLRFDPAISLAANFTSPITETWLEIGFGGGEHARALAETNPGVGLIAAEVFEQGQCSLLAALVGEGEEASGALPGNLRLWDDDARRLLHALPDAGLSKLFLMFPDPWPKARHQKRRFVHPTNVALAARCLREGAEWRIASDDPTYQQWVIEVMGNQPFFSGTAPKTVRPDAWPPTRYEAKALAAQRKPLYWSYRRTSAPVPIEAESP